MENVSMAKTGQPLSGISVLVVDDDHGIGEELNDYLRSHGMHVEIARDIVGARYRLGSRAFDILLLDLWLGSENGFDFLREVRKDRLIPCIMMTAQNDITDKIVGLELGADDYLFKPLNMRELLARMRALLRRALAPVPGEEPAPAAAPRQDGGTTAWRFDPMRRNLCAPDGCPIPLTTAECDLLTELVANRGHTQSRDELCRRVFNREWQPYDRSLDGVVVNLRRKLEPDPEHPLVIKTVRGKGYVFTGFPDSTA